MRRTAPVLAATALALGSLVCAGAATAAPPKKPTSPRLSLTVTGSTSAGFAYHVLGTQYGDVQPGGHLELTCGSASTICGPVPPPWIGGPVDSTADGGSFFVDYPFACGSNVRYAQAVDNDGTRSRRVKAPC